MGCILSFVHTLPKQTKRLIRHSELTSNHICSADCRRGMNYRSVMSIPGEHGSAVLEELGYKSDGHGFETQCAKWFLPVYLILPVGSASVEN